MRRYAPLEQDDAGALVDPLAIGSVADAGGKLQGRRVDGVDHAHRTRRLQAFIDPGERGCEGLVRQSLALEPGSEASAHLRRVEGGIEIPAQKKRPDAADIVATLLQPGDPAA